MPSSFSNISPFDAHLGYWLRMVSNHVSHAFKRKVEAEGVTVAEWVVLRVLFETDDINPSQIAAALGMTRGAISKLVDRLAAKELVRCSASKTDRRFQSVALTPAGRRLVPLLASLADQNDAEFFAALSNQQRDALMKLLQTVAGRRGLSDVPID